MSKLDFVRYFYYVAREKSIIKAAALLNVPRSTLGKSIQALETGYGHTLFVRKKSGLELTAKGKQMFRLTAHAVQELDQSLHLFNRPNDDDDANEQVLRIITTTGLSHLWLINRLRFFQEKHPKVQIQIHTTNDNVDFLSSGYDVGILPRFVDTQGVVRRRILVTHHRLLASQAYIKANGRPTSLNDLVHHKLIGFYLDSNNHRGPVDWHLSFLGQGVLKPAIIVDSAIGVIECIRKGLGIGFLPLEMPYLDEFGFVNLIPDFDEIQASIYFVVHKNQALSGQGLIPDFYRTLSTKAP